MKNSRDSVFLFIILLDGLAGGPTTTSVTFENRLNAELARRCQRAVKTL
jgi:hypothetical protein